MTRPDTNNSGQTGLDLHIYFNDTLTHSIAYPITATPLAFNTLLGNVNAGDVVRVAIGPQNNRFTMASSVGQARPLANTSIWVPAN